MVNKVTPETMTVAQAIAEGYDKCLQDGYSTVSDIDDIDPEDLEDETYWICEKEPDVFSVSPEELRSMMSDHVDQYDNADSEGIVAQSILDIPVEKFNQASELLSGIIAGKKWWSATNIQLIP